MNATGYNKDDRIVFPYSNPELLTSNYSQFQMVVKIKYDNIFMEVDVFSLD